MQSRFTTDAPKPHIKLTYEITQIALLRIYYIQKHKICQEVALKKLKINQIIFAILAENMNIAHICAAYSSFDSLDLCLVRLVTNQKWKSACFSNTDLTFFYVHVTL